MKYLYATKPKLAKKWSKKYGKPKNLNEYIKSGKK